MTVNVSSTLAVPSEAVTLMYSGRGAVSVGVPLNVREAASNFSQLEGRLAVLPVTLVMVSSTVPVPSAFCITSTVYVSAVPSASAKVLAGIW